jgi:hypothetical protein
MRILKSVVLSFLACSQIWLFPLVDDHQSGYITKIEKETLIVRRQHYHPWYIETKLQTS